MNKKRVLNIREKLILVILPLTIIPLILVSGSIYYASQKSMKKEVSNYMQQYLTQLFNTVDNKLETTILMNAQITVNPQVIEAVKHYDAANQATREKYKQQIKNVFTACLSTYSNVKGIYIIDNYGNEFFSSRDYGTSLDEIEQRDWYQRTIENEGKYTVFIDESCNADNRNSDKMIGIARSIIDIYTHKSYGIVLTEIPYQTISDSVLTQNSNSMMRESGIFIMDEKNQLIYSSSDEEIYNTLIQTNSDFSEGRSFEKVNNSEVIVLKNKAKVTEWTYIYMCDMKYIMQEINEIRSFIILLVAFFIVLILCFVFWYTGIFLKPVYHLTNAMKEMKSGDYSVRVTPTTQDEIGYLVNTFNDMADNIEDLIQKVYTARLTQKEAQLHMLQQQINPHFIYNTFESMRGLALLQNDRQVADMIKVMSDFMRYNTLRGEDSTDLQTELKHVEDYVKIQNYRFSDKITLVVAMPEVMKSIRVPKFILQPIVENSIIHGFAELREDCQIEISGFCETDIILKVIDNGCGISEQELEKMNLLLDQAVDAKSIIRDNRTNIGINNVNERLKLQYGDKYGLHFESNKGNGTIVLVKMPRMGE